MTETKAAPKRTSKAAASKAAPKADAFAFPSMPNMPTMPTMANMPNMANMEVPTAVREIAEKSIAQAKEGYARMKTAAEEATDMLEDSYESSRQGALEINMKALDAAKDTTDATFAFVKDMMAVKSFSEAIEVQTAFARKQFDTSMAQAKEMQELVSKVATEASQPAKDAMTKSFKGIQTA